MTLEEILGFAAEAATLGIMERGAGSALAKVLGFNGEDDPR